MHHCIILFVLLPLSKKQLKKLIKLIIELLKHLL